MTSHISSAMGFLTTSLHKNCQNDVKLLETWWFWPILGKVERAELTCEVIKKSCSTFLIKFWLYVCPLIVLCFVATLTYKTFVVWWQISFATSSRTNLDQNDNFEKFCHHCTVTRKCCKNVYCFAMHDYFFLQEWKTFSSFYFNCVLWKWKLKVEIGVLNILPNIICFKNG